MRVTLPASTFTPYGFPDDLYFVAFSKEGAMEFMGEKGHGATGSTPRTCCGVILSQYSDYSIFHSKKIIGLASASTLFP